MIYYYFTVPIIPEFLYDIKHPNNTLSEHLDGPHHLSTTQISTPVIPASLDNSKCICKCPQGNFTNGQLEHLMGTTSTANQIGILKKSTR